MTTPQRIQVYWRHPGGHKDRNTTTDVSRNSRWGNHHPVGTERPYKSCGYCDGALHTREKAIALYAQYLADNPHVRDQARHDLTGYDLACYCQPEQPCHADQLLTVANGHDPPANQHPQATTAREPVDRVPSPRDERPDRAHLPQDTAPHR